MPTYRPDVEAVVSEGAPSTRPITALGPTEARVSCPSCGSPYIATFADGEPRGIGLAGFRCAAGDCPNNRPGADKPMSR